MIYHIAEEYVYLMLKIAGLKLRVLSFFKSLRICGSQNVFVPRISGILPSV